MRVRWKAFQYAHRNNRRCWQRSFCTTGVRFIYVTSVRSECCCKQDVRYKRCCECWRRNDKKTWCVGTGCSQPLSCSSNWLACCWWCSQNWKAAATCFNQQWYDHKHWFRSTSIILQASFYKHIPGVLSWREALTQWEHGCPSKNRLVNLKEWPHATRTNDLKYKYHDRKLIAVEYLRLGDPTFVQKYNPDNCTLTLLKQKIINVEHRSASTNVVTQDNDIQSHSYYVECSVIHGFQNVMNNSKNNKIYNW